MTARSLAWCALRSSGGIVSSSYRSASEESGYRARASKMPCAVCSISAFRALPNGGGVGGRWPGEIVVHNVFAVAVAHFQPSADGAHPRHVDVGGENTEVVERGVGDDFDKITANHIRRHESHGNISSFFGRRFRNHNIIRLRHILHMETCGRVGKFARSRHQFRDFFVPAADVVEVACVLPFFSEHGKQVF